MPSPENAHSAGYQQRLCISNIKLVSGTLPARAVGEAPADRERRMRKHAAARPSARPVPFRLPGTHSVDMNHTKCILVYERARVTGTQIVSWNKPSAVLHMLRGQSCLHRPVELSAKSRADKELFRKTTYSHKAK
jgi:hypothetical protein